jgi:hypothetical protein
MYSTSRSKMYLHWHKILKEMYDSQKSNYLAGDVATFLTSSLFWHLCGQCVSEAFSWFYDVKDSSWPGVHTRGNVSGKHPANVGEKPPIILKLDISGFTLLIPNLWWTHVHNLDRHLENKYLHINIDNTLVIYSLCTHFDQLPEGPNPATSCAWKNESIILTFSREIVELLVVCICEQAVKVSKAHGDFHPSQTRTPTCLFHDLFLLGQYKSNLGPLAHFRNYQGLWKHRAKWYPAKQFPHQSGLIWANLQ